MDYQELQSECLTCTQEMEADSLRVQNAHNSTVTDVLRKHFWFTEVDFKDAIICQTCWDQVNFFHQFYLSAEELYRTRLSSLIVKSEPAMDEIGCTDEQMPELPECNFEVESVPAECSVKQEPAAEVGNDSEHMQSSAEENDDREDNSEEAQHSTETGKKRRRIYNLYKRGRECQAQDDYIKQHVKYFCKQCGEESESFLLYEKHGLEVHGVKSSHIECCGRKFYRRSRLYDHVRVLNNPGEFHCKPCQRNFTAKEGLGFHMREYHAPEGQRRHKCERCSKTFAVKSVFTSHVQKHVIQDRAERYNCSECTKSFCRSSALKAHVDYVHMGIVSHKCPFCVNTYISSRGVNRHMKSMHPNEWQEQQISKEALVGDISLV